MRDDLKARFARSADRELGGLKTSHKYLDPDTIEYGIKNSAANKDDEDFVKKSLHSNLKLIDPAWGGVYQYSTHGDWDNAHFEKLAVKQADDMRMYAYAYQFFKEREYLAAVKDIRRYLDTFLRSAEGAFYTSQDADVVAGKHSAEFFKLSDAERRKQGIPRIDKNIYSSENGKIISSLAVVYSATADESALAEAIQAAEWVKAHRSLANGGFTHGEKDQSGPYLCDTLYMGQAFLNLYAVTGDRKWLASAETAAEYLALIFASDAQQAGYLTSKPGGRLLKPKPLISENIAAVRFLSMLTQYTGKPEYKKSAEVALRFLATKEVVTESITEIGVVLADDDYNSPPLHIVTIGQKADHIARELFAESLKYPALSKRTEWWDRREGEMPNPDVQYPNLPKPAAFVCTNRRCSLPIFKPEDLPKTVRKLSS